MICEVAEAEVGRWQEGERFVLRERMRALTFEVIVRAVFGVTERERIERLRSALVSLINMQMIFVMPNALRRDLGRFSPWGQFQRRLKAADALIYKEIARRRGESDLDDRTDVLSLLLRAPDEDGQPMTDVELRDELMTMLLAGHETTATGLAFAFDLLLREPRVLSRLRDELDGDDDTYLDAVVTETLRLRPIRRCIGAALAQAEMAEVIRTVVSRVDLEPTRPDREPVVMRGITLVPRHGTPVVVRRTGKLTAASAGRAKQTSA